MLRTQYLRAAFQHPDDNSVRISLDTRVCMNKENVRAGAEWYVKEDMLLEQNIHRFPYAILEVKLQESFKQKRPEWLTSLMNSPYLTHVERYSKFCHGVAVHYPEKLRAVPHWVAVGNKFESMYTNGPFRSAVIKSIKPGIPLEEKGKEIKNKDKGREKDKEKDIAPKENEKEKDKVAAPGDGDDHPTATNCLGDLFGIGKKPVSNRMKVEPKTYFANERTLLSWMNSAILMGSTGAALLSFGKTALDTKATAAGLAFIPISILIFIYALFTYHRRLHLIHNRIPTGYHDPFGPSILTVLLIIAMILSAVFVVSFK